MLSIAREYGVSPVRIIEENALNDPDRLPVGHCIAIYRASRSYTVRGGDTFEGICKRFGIDAREICKFNPGIGERRLLYPGQALSLGRVESSFGGLTVNGCVSKHISGAKLRLFASALTYLTIIDSDFHPRSGCGSRKERDLIDFSYQNGILPLLSLRPFGDPLALADAVVRSGYRGAHFIDGRPKKSTSAYAEAMKKRGLTVLGTYSNGEPSNSFDWVQIPFGDHRLTSKERFSDLLKNDEITRQMMPELPCFGVELSLPDHSSVRTLPLADCPRLAYRRNAVIEHSKSGKASFTFTASGSAGARERHEVIFDDLEAIQKGLAVLGESGVCGISVYPEWCHSGLPTLLHRGFDVIQSKV